MRSPQARRTGVGYSLRSGSKLALVLALLLPAACGEERSTEVPDEPGPEYTTESVDCSNGCKDTFTDANDTPLAAHSPDVGEFTWRRIEDFGTYSPVIRGNSVGVDGVDTLDGQFQGEPIE
jgi:hypothetical protein